MNKIVLKIEGMHCNKCAERLENALKEKNNIEKVKVNFKKKEAIINYKDITLEQIKTYIEDSGFKIAE